jgi:hypothetical protein
MTKDQTYKSVLLICTTLIMLAGAVVGWFRPEADVGGSLLSTGSFLFAVIFMFVDINDRPKQ